jgi:hypothetical protein
MKKILLVTGLLFAGYAVYPQVLISLIFGKALNSGKVEFGLDGGLAVSNLGGLEHAHYKSGFNLGFYFDIKLRNPSLVFNTGVVVKSSMGASGLPVYSLNDPHLDSVFAGGTVDRNLHYFQVPFMLKYKFGQHFYARGGIQLALRNKCSDVFINSVKDKDDLEYRIDIREKYHHLDGGLIVGAGYRLMKGQGMNFGITYYLGLIDARVEDAGNNQYNRAFYFNVGIPIGKKPAAAQ